MQKQKLLEILRLLQQEADNEHPLKCSEIIARLSQKGMSAERKSVYSDIDIPVSYTHLDVYKRQSTFCARPAGTSAIRKIKATG